MFERPLTIVPAVLTAILLLGSVLGGRSSRADTWASPTTREYRSSNDQYVARVVPRAAEGNGEPPRVSVLAVDTRAEQFRWTARLSNEVSPVEARVSDDGKFVVTLDNWGRVGYGNDVLAIYSESGQIGKFSFEVIVGDLVERQREYNFHQLFDHSVSSRRWRKHSFADFDGVGDSSSFGIWLDWAAQWFVWRLSDGSPVELTGDLLKRWNEKGQSWARVQLQLPEVGGKPPGTVMRQWTEEAQAWSRTKSERYRRKIIACRYLAYLKDPADRSFLEHALTSDEMNVNWEMELRANADRALAILDRSADDFRSLSADDAPTYHRLGVINLRIQLPEPTANRGQVYVSVFSESVKPEHWRAAQPEHRTGQGLKSSSVQTEGGAVELSVRPVRPGKYWVKAIWDTTGPYEYDLSAYEGMREWSELTGVAPVAMEGDFETKAARLFEVTAGKTMNITLDCSSPGDAESLKR